MTTLMLADVQDHALTFDLRDLLELLAPRSLDAVWTVSDVEFPEREDDLFEAYGDTGDHLADLAETRSRLAGGVLLVIADGITQVIWGTFSGSLDGSAKPWVVISAI